MPPIKNTGLKIHLLKKIMHMVFKKSLNILKYSLGILFYVPIDFTAICLAIVYL